MAFSDSNNKHTLIVTQMGNPKKPNTLKWKLNGFMRVTEPSGETFLQPLPSDSDQLIGIYFNAIDFVEPVAHASEGGDYDLTHYHADMVVGRRRN
jgi:hypothetical protein